MIPGPGSASPVAVPAWRRIVGWLAPSVFAVCAAAALAGVVEGLVNTDGIRSALAAAGFACLVALPIGFALTLLARGLWAAWMPRSLRADLIEADGGAPRLAAWLLFLCLASLGFAWALWDGVRLLFQNTSGTSMVIALGTVMIGLTAIAVLIAVSRPLLLGFTALARRAGARLRWRGRPATTPLRVLALAGAIALGGGVAGWLLVISPRIGHVDLSIAIYPLIFLIVAALAHALWPWLARRALRRRLATGLAVAAAAGTIGVALSVRAGDPSLLLAIWGEYSVAGAAIDGLYDLEDVRAELHMTAFRPAERAGAPHPDIILITIDTVRADRTSPYGGPAKMPNLSELADSGALFEWAFSPSNVTRRSIPSMVLGVSPPRVKGKVKGWALRLDPRHVTVAERLRAGGYDTAGFFCCRSFWDPARHIGLERGIDHLEFERDGAQLARQARDWLEARAEARDAAGADAAAARPTFVWIHFLEPHGWKGKRKIFPALVEERLRMYDTTLRNVDGFLETVLSSFADRPAAERPIVVVTSDHGEGLGDHGNPHHASDLYNSQTHVPFVVAGPGITPRRLREVVSLTSLTPTLLDLAGYEPPGQPDMDTPSIAPLITGARPETPDGGEAYLVMLRDRSIPKTRRALVQGKWKLVTDAAASLPRAELYDLRADPAEKRDVAAAHPDVVETLRKALLEKIRTVDRIAPF